jgi:hypothetical protein
MPVIPATEISIDLKANTLCIPLPAGVDAAALDGIRLGTLDIGSKGRLLGIELGPFYLSVMDAEPGHDDLVRSADVPVTVSMIDMNGTNSGTASRFGVTFKRAGGSYEITYPSGNQCWTRHNVDQKNGHSIQTCAVIIGHEASTF